MPRRRASRIYTRSQGGERRFYGDFRDLGGGREALRPAGEKLATTDPDVAAKLAAARVKELEEARRHQVILGRAKRATLEAFASHHLIQKAKGGTSERWLQQAEQKLTAAVGFFGAERDLETIQVADVQAWVDHLSRLPGRGGKRLSGGTLRHYLNVLSNLFTRAVSEGYVPLGHNPVAGLLEKPTPAREEARWLQPHDAALLLEAARLYRPAVDPVEQPHGGSISAHPHPHVFELLATLLLTGGRASEVLGLEVDDVSFRRRTVTFRPNRWRRLKTKTSHRAVPLWPQLEEILRGYLARREREGGMGVLLFPSARGREEGMIRDTRKALDAVARRAGWADGEIRSKVFRHTYCAARLQTLDRGHPVAVWTVARELGHGGTSMVERIYGHLGAVRFRGEEVRFRLEDHLEDEDHGETLRRRLEELQAPVRGGGLSL